MLFKDGAWDLKLARRWKSIVGSEHAHTARALPVASRGRCAGRRLCRQEAVCEAGAGVGCWAAPAGGGVWRRPSGGGMGEGVKSEGVVVQKEPASLCVAQATLQWLFTGAIPLLTGTGALTCSVSDLGRFTPP